MAQPLDVKRLVETGRQFTESGRSQARHLGNDLLSQGRLATEQISAVIEELTSRGSRERIEELRGTVRDEVQHALRTLRASMNEDLAKVQSGVDRVVDELRNQRREYAEELRGAVRDEMQRQLGTLGLAAKDDLAALRQSIKDDLIALDAQAQELRGAVRDEMQRQLGTLGLAAKDDLAALRQSIKDDLIALESRLERRGESPTGGSDDRASQAAPVQVTPPHGHSTVMDPPTP